MPSHLTRHVFRCILANEPIIHRGCLRRRGYSSMRALSPLSRSFRGQHAINVPAISQRRTFFKNFNPFKKKQRDSDEANVDPGIDKLMELSKRQRMRARMPPPAEVVTALRRFFDHRLAQKKGIEDTQAQLAVEAIQYLSSEKLRQSEDGRLTGHLVLSAVIALIQAQNPTEVHGQLAKLLFETSKTMRKRTHVLAAKAYIKTLGATGRGSEAQHLALECEESLKADSSADQDRAVQQTEVVKNDGENSQLQESTDPTQTNPVKQMWVSVAWATARTDDEAQLLAVLELLRLRGYFPHPSVANAVLGFYLRGDNLGAVKTWFMDTWRLYTDSTTMDDQTKALRKAHSLRQVIMFCLEKRHLQFGHEVVRMATMDNPLKPVWDVIFLWAVGTGKGADEIDRMISVMESYNKSIPDRDQWRHPDIATINCLVEFATTRNDPYMAERFIALGHQRGIQPDARTYVLQMEYRLKVKDVDGALIAYTNLQSQDLSDNRDVPTVNDLIVALCNSKRHDFDTIMNVVADLSERRARFEALTVSHLALLHLGRDEFHDVIDLLNTHAFQYSSSERQAIRDAIIKFALDPKTPVARSWDAYSVLRSIFDEMARPQRTDFMVHFFRQERPDIAVHVFSGMRQHSRADTIPTNDTYATAFLECAKIRDLESLEVIHNQLKLDYNINIDTHLYNTLIIAYTACGKPRLAMDFWDDIVTSKEGPSYNTIHVALRACEKSVFGDLKAQRIWEKLRRQKVDLDQAMWASYAAALAGNGDNELAISTIEEAESKKEVEVDAFLLGSLMSGCPGPVKQEEIEAWAKEKYPHAWAKLEKIGFDEDEVGMKTAKIDRSVSP